MAWIKLGWYDAVGAGLVVAFAAWVGVSALVGTGDPWPQIALVAAAAIAYVVGRVLGGRRPVFVAAVIVVCILVGTALSGPAAISGGPLAPPLGYGNANGALYTEGVAAACIVATLANKEPARRVAGVLAIVLLGLAVATLSKTAAILAAGILVIAIVAHRMPRRLILLAPLVVAATVAVTIVLGLTNRDSVAPHLVARLSERRPQLWEEAMEIATSNPVFGVGSGMFDQTSPIALADADARWAHSAYLQVAAELGIVGVVLLGLLLLWGFGALYRSRQDVRLLVIGTAAATAFAVHAAIDYVAHFPIVVVVAGLLAGLASSRGSIPVAQDRMEAG